jgi:hypothetical protein
MFSFHEPLGIFDNFSVLRKYEKSGGDANNLGE